MIFDPHTVKLTLEDYDKRRARLKDELDSRRAKAHAADPRLAQIDADLRVKVLEISLAGVRHASPEEINKIKDDALALTADRAELLVECGFPYDYLAHIHECDICADKGFIGATPCECFAGHYRETQNSELSKTLNIGGQSFELFDFNLYSPETDPETGVSPRENIEAAYSFCSDFANNFDNRFGGILLYGDTGVGKTYLSACIAKVVADKGYSVVYETSYNLFTRYEQKRFGRGDDDAAVDIRRYEGCDLLILDDLGTELINNLTITNLYHIVNLRLTEKRRIVINTNLSPGELTNVYSRQIASRLDGDLKPFYIFGQDLRKK